LIGFEFPLDQSGQWDGFNDPGMEHFTGNPFQHLGREVPQNTIDATETSPAKIRISLIKVAMSDIPDVDTLRATVELCAKSADEDDGDKSSKFFADARKLLARPDVAVLQISDHNTTGVRGPCENGKPYFALMKATGQSRKAETSTGSYGIGKFAPFTVSALRTVFVSTVWQDSQAGWHHYVQGKSVLMSFLDHEGSTHRGTGFWGVKNKCQPVEGQLSTIPSWLRRAAAEDELAHSAGTTISVVGFVATKGWESVLAANIVENFFGAIARGELEVEIEGGLIISASSLPALLNDPALSAAISDQEGEPERFQNAGSYLRTLSDDAEVIRVSTENLHLGECELRIRIGEGLPKKVAVLRNGMLITEGMQNLKRFGDFKEFVAVLECKSTKGLALLRGMEPPRHDAFEPDRLPPDKRSVGRLALKEISKWVRDMLQRYAQDPVSEETNLDELADFFADEAQDGAAKRRDENPSGAIIIRARAVKPKQGRSIGAADAPLPAEQAEDEAEGDRERGEQSGSGSGGAGAKSERTGDDASSSGQPEGGAGKSPTVATRAIAVRDVRAIPLDTSRRRIAFTPLQTGIIRLELQDSGADTNHPLEVKAASKGTVKAGRIEFLGVVANSRFTLDVELSSAFAGTIRVVTDAV
jgi:hypothetical protein